MRHYSGMIFLSFFWILQVFAEPLMCDNHPNKADSYVLALSWQPAFCKLYGKDKPKPECSHLREEDYAASHFSLHGLWPNQTSCGTHYGFCNAEPKSSHCDYPPINLREDVSLQLAILMPSYGAHSCLERHEWNKHGGCQSRDADNYFSIGMRLIEDINHSSFGALLHESVGKTVSRKKLLERLKENFGDDILTKVYLGCRGNILIDVYFSLPSAFADDEPLTSIIQNAKSIGQSSDCPETIRVVNMANV